jgi:ABC-type transporter Mla MlaB component
VFRLDKELAEGRTRLTFDGELSTECIESLERCCEEALKDGKPLDLILRDITGVDEAGQALLRRLARRGVCLFAKGVYVSYLLDTIRGNVSAGGNGLEFRLRCD